MDSTTKVTLAILGVAAIGGLAVVTVMINKPAAPTTTVTTNDTTQTHGGVVSSLSGLFKGLNLHILG